MNKGAKNPIRINSVSELNQLLGLPKPLHPLIALNRNNQMTIDASLLPQSFLFNFYKISYKNTQKGKIGYGQSYYDFDEGGLIFTAPNQLLTVNEDDIEYDGWSLIFHSDFIRNYPLGKSISKYGFFSYATNEALFLSDKELKTIFSVFESIKEELNNNIDDFSQDVLISQIEVLLNYSNRFYKRQFITRKAVNHDVLAELEHLLHEYFEKGESIKKGVLTVEYLANRLNMSPRYLGDMLRSLTGQNARQHIHRMLIEKAKEYLITTNWSVSEIAYQLGFEHSQSFNKLFKKKTNFTPTEFKQSFNLN